MRTAQTSHRVAKPGGRRRKAPTAHRASGQDRVGEVRRPLIYRTPLLVGALALVVAGACAVEIQPDLVGATSSVATAAAAGEKPSTRSVATAISRSGVDRQVLLRQAETQARQRAQALAGLTADSKRRSTVLLAARKRRLARQWVLPLTGYRLTARFGESSSLWSTTHTGLDFAAPSGTKLVAAARGTVTESGYAGSYGIRTIIELSDGTELWYCHQSSTSVRAGEQVDPGQMVGAVGATGNVTGPHLHLEVRPGGGGPGRSRTGTARAQRRSMSALPVSSRSSRCRA